MRRHHRESFFVVNDWRVLESDGERTSRRIPTVAEQQLSFRFSRLSRTKGVQISARLRADLARAMTSEAVGPAPDSDADKGGAVPAGYTYLGQFVDHDLTMDATQVGLGDPVPVEDLLQGRSPALDLDSLYGLGPGHSSSRPFYEHDGRLKVGATLGVPVPPDVPAANKDQVGFDLPRAGVGGTRAERRAALIPDARNDENLAVGQLHLAFIRFHNRLHQELARRGVPARLLFRATREQVVKHYQWMLRTDFLPRIVDPAIVEDVFTEGRRHVQPGAGGHATMPIEFSVAAYRLGHSMIRGEYQWNRFFNSHGGPGGAARLGALFRFSGTSGNLSPGPDDLADLDDVHSGDNLRLPGNWITDYRRLFDFAAAGRPDLAVPAEDFNLAKRLDTRLVDPLATLPAGTFAGRGRPVAQPIHRNLAFRNLTRAAMVELATGPQMAKEMDLEPLTDAEILRGDGNGATLDGLTADQRTELATHTPLWFYVLREAEVNPARPGRLTGVGGRLVAEVFHRAMEGSLHSLVRDPQWRPWLPSRRPGVFTMPDLLLYAFEGRADLLNPMGEGPLLNP